MGQIKKILTHQQIRAVRDRLRSGEYQKDIAPDYNMSVSCLAKILAEE